LLFTKVVKQSAEFSVQGIIHSMLWICIKQVEPSQSTNKAIYSPLRIYVGNCGFAFKTEILMPYSEKSTTCYTKSNPFL